MRPRLLVLRRNTAASLRHSARPFASSATRCFPSVTPDPAEKSDEPQPQSWANTGFRMFEAAATTFASIAVIGLISYGYTKIYKYNVLNKIENAFKPGDPVLDVAAAGGGPDARFHWIERSEQKIIDDIVSGASQGHYYLIVGEKGQGKTSMILEAMRKINGDGVSMFDAHADLEIFRIRLGRAIDFEFHEDNMGSLFSIRGPRDASALLDIERAFNKLEKVALQRRKTGERPLIIVINSMHLLRDDEDGRDLLELIQQRAEQWAASKLATIVCNSDDYWVYERLKQHATRMEVLPIHDLSKQKSMEALRAYRLHLSYEEPSSNVLEEVYERVGGRLAFLIRAAKSPDMLAVCEDICQKEKQWFLNQCWILGEEMDDDVMDQQKYASAAMVLAKALVDLEKDMEDQYDPGIGHQLPSMPLHKARQTMTRADFMQSLDRLDIFHIDSYALVRADSVPMQRAFREVCSEEGFDDYLEATLDRISAIESLGRTRELTIKDLWDGGKYNISVNKADKSGRQEISFQVATDQAEDDKDQGVRLIDAVMRECVRESVKADEENSE